MKRSSGILLHISSLPSDYAIGDFGPSAYQFIDFLKAAGQSYWQILPLNPTDFVFGNSPYSSPSAFAGNPLFISPELLKRDGFLKDSDLPIQKYDPDAVDYFVAINLKKDILKKSFQTFHKTKNLAKEFNDFQKNNSDWVDDYALFTVLKVHFNQALWTTWPEEIKRRHPKALAQLKEQLKNEIDQEKFNQFIFYRQWEELKAYARQSKIGFIGDIPIYVNFDSVDVWCNPEFFKLDANFNPTVVAGVPPDYFSKTGQRWGNPVYNWDALKKDCYRWWIKRLEHNLKLFDVVRIDHFRGLVQYWEVPIQEETAINGHWAPVPTDDFLTTVQKHFKNLPIIAEDLGLITDDVRETMSRYNFPGMKILLFAFNEDIKKHPYLPHNYIENCVVYTGTHDNNTVQGWFQTETTPQERENLAQYLGHPLEDQKIHWNLIEIALQSKADLALIPMQDYLGLSANARMNTPGSVKNNWRWRMAHNILSNMTLASQVSHLVKKSSR